MVMTSPLQFSVGTAAPHANAADAACLEPCKIKPHRVFVGIKIVPELAQILAGMAKQLGNEGVRLVPDHDIHLTLVPPWNENDVVGASEKLRHAIFGFGCLSLTFENLRYGPTARHPHLLWVECTVSSELSGLRTALLTSFGQVDPRPFRPHITLARIPRGGRIIARKHPLGQSPSLTQHVTSVELFQSPPKGGSGDQVLASLALGSEQRCGDPANGTMAKDD